MRVFIYIMWNKGRTSLTHALEAFLENMNLTSSRLKLESAHFWVEMYKNTELWNWPKMVLPLKSYTVKLGIKELLNKEQIGFNELFTDYSYLSNKRVGCNKRVGWNF